MSARSRKPLSGAAGPSGGGTGIGPNNARQHLSEADSKFFHDRAATEQLRAEAKSLFERLPAPQTPGTNRGTLAVRLAERQGKHNLVPFLKELEIEDGRHIYEGPDTLPPPAKNQRKPKKRSPERIARLLLSTGSSRRKPQK
jgi:hypothetical protein